MADISIKAVNGVCVPGHASSEPLPSLEAEKCATLKKFEDAFAKGTPEKTLDLKELGEILPEAGQPASEGLVGGINLLLDNLVEQKMSLVLDGEESPVFFDADVFGVFKLPEMATFLGRPVASHIARIHRLEVIQKLRETYQKNPAMKSATIEKTLKPFCDEKEKVFQEGVAEGMRDFKTTLALSAGYLPLSANFYRYFRDPEKTGAALCGKAAGEGSFIEKGEENSAEKDLIGQDKLFRDIILVGSIPPKIAKKLVTWIEEVGKNFKDADFSLKRLPQNYFIPPYGLSDLDRKNWYDAVNAAIRFREVLDQALLRIGKIEDLKRFGVPAEDLKIFADYRLKIQEVIERLNKQVGTAIAEVAPSHDKSLIRAQLRFLGQEEAEDTFEMAKVFLARHMFKDPASLGRIAVWEQVHYFFSKWKQVDKAANHTPMFISRTDFKPAVYVSRDIETRAPIATFGPFFKGCTTTPVDVDGDHVMDSVEFCIDQPQAGTSDLRTEVFFEDGVVHQAQLLYSEQDNKPFCSQGCYFTLAEKKESSAPGLFLEKLDPKTQEIRPFALAKNFGRVWWRGKTAIFLTGDFQPSNQQIWSLRPSSSISNAKAPLKAIDLVGPSSGFSNFFQQINSAEPYGLTKGGIPFWPGSDGFGATINVENIKEFRVDEEGRIEWGAHLSFHVQNFIFPFAPGTMLASLEPDFTFEERPDGTKHGIRNGGALLFPSPILPIPHFDLGVTANLHRKEVSWLYLTAEAGMQYYIGLVPSITASAMETVTKTGELVQFQTVIHNPQLNNVFVPTVGAGFHTDIPLQYGMYLRGGMMCYWHFPSFGSSLVTLGAHYECPVWNMGVGREW